MVTSVVRQIVKTQTDNRKSYAMVVLLLGPANVVRAINMLSVLVVENAPTSNMVILFKE